MSADQLLFAAMCIMAAIGLALLAMIGDEEKE